MMKERIEDMRGLDGAEEDGVLDNALSQRNCSNN